MRTSQLKDKVKYHSRTTHGLITDVQILVNVQYNLNSTVIFRLNVLEYYKQKIRIASNGISVAN